MQSDLLSGRAWECSPTAPGAAACPDDLRALGSLGWRPAEVPGTAAGAVRSAGDDPDCTDFDAFDWWFRCHFACPTEAPAPYVLELGGLATIADVWLNGRHLLHTENMFRSYEVEIDSLEDENDLWIRFSSLNVALSACRNRPRWKTYLVAHQNLRFIRTTLLGRLRGMGCDSRSGRAVQADPARLS